MENIFAMPHSLYDLCFFTMYGDLNNAFAVHVNSDEEMIKKMIAGMKSYTLGFKSIDYVYKSYSERWIFKDKNADYLRKCHDILSPHMKMLSALATSLNKWKGDINIGRFEVVAGVSRMENTFHSIHFLIARGYHIEAIALTRVVLEQAAWYYHVYESEDKEFFGIMPNKCINKAFKRFIPDAGKLYGLLSKYSHITPDVTKDFIAISVVEGADENILDHTIILSNDRFRAISLKLYFYTIEILLRVVENAMCGYNIQFDFDKEIGRTKEYIGLIDESFPVRADDSAQV